MIITPPILPPSFDAPAQVQLIPDAELKMRLKYTALCYEYKNTTILRIAADHDGLYSHWVYTEPSSCFRKPVAVAVTHAEYSKGTHDAQDVLEKYDPVSNYNHIFSKNNIMPSVLPVPPKPIYSDFPNIWLASN